MSKNNIDISHRDDNQKQYRDYFGIVDKYLIQCNYDPEKEGENKDGYIIFIDCENDLDYIDLRTNNDENTEKEINRAIAKLQFAEAVPTKHLPDDVQIEFKRSLGIGYIHALNGQFEDIPAIISEAQLYLKKRNREYSRKLFLSSGAPAAIIAFIFGFIFYLLDIKSSWGYGIIFGVLGAYVSIWMRYGKINNSGYGGIFLHLLECYSRIFIGVIFALVAMVAIRCHLILPSLQNNEELMTFILASFISAFSERFIPSILDQITKNSKNDDKSNTEA